MKAFDREYSCVLPRKDMPVVQRFNALAAEKGRIGRNTATLIVEGKRLLVPWIDYPAFPFPHLMSAGSRGHNVDTAIFGVGGISKSGLSITILEEAD